MLRIFHTEWSREMLLEAWMDDPIACCEKCGVVPPASVLDSDGNVPHSVSDHDLRSPTQTTMNNENTIVSFISNYTPKTQ